MRMITSDSHCPYQHKRAAFHSMVHRLCRLPLSVDSYRIEYAYIKEVARVNGYGAKMIDDLILRHSNKIMRSNRSTFILSNSVEPNKRVSMKFVPAVTNKLKNIFKDHNMDIVFRSDNNLSNLLGSTKDKTADMKKSGVYAVQCGDCDGIYYGQTKRSIGVRFKEHDRDIGNNNSKGSALAAHVLESGHFNVSVDNLRLVKHVHDYRRLDAVESFYIQKDDNAINRDNGNVESCLFARV